MASGNAQVEAAPGAAGQRRSDQAVGIFGQRRVGVQEQQRVAGAERGAGVHRRAAAARNGDDAVGERLRQAARVPSRLPPSTTMISAPRARNGCKRRSAAAMIAASLSTGITMVSRPMGIQAC